MTFQLPQLPYNTSAFEGTLSMEAFDYHHGKHLKTYVDKLNKLLEDSSLKNSSLEEIIKHSDGSLFNNAAQCWNHVFYFHCLSANPKHWLPSKELCKVLNSSFGSLKEFQEKFISHAMENFGSGWTWLAKNDVGDLHILNTPNANNPITLNMTPLLAIDLWEHAYYIDYRNSRESYLGAIFKMINWEFASICYESIQLFNANNHLKPPKN